MENSNTTLNTLDFELLRNNIDKKRTKSLDLFNETFNENNKPPKEIAIDENITDESYKKQVENYNNLITKLNYRTPKSYENKTEEEQKEIDKKAKQSVRGLILGLGNAISYNQIYRNKIEEKINKFKEEISDEINKVQAEQKDLISKIAEKQNLINEFEKSKLEFNNKENLEQEIENLEKNLKKINELNISIQFKITVQSKLDVNIEEDAETFRRVNEELSNPLQEVDKLKDNLKAQTEALNKSLTEFGITDSITNYSDKQIDQADLEDTNSFDNTNEILTQLKNIKAYDKLKTQDKITDEEINKLKEDLTILQAQKNTSQDMLEKLQNYDNILGQASDIAKQHQETEKLILDYFTSFANKITDDKNEQETLIKALIKENNSLNKKDQTIFLQRIERINKNLEIANKIEKLENNISISQQQKDQMSINETIESIKTSKANVMNNLRQGIIPITYTREETNGEGKKSNAEESLTLLELSIESLESKLENNIDKLLEKERALRDKKPSITGEQKIEKEKIVNQINGISLDNMNARNEENKISKIEKLIEINKKLEDRKQERKENRLQITKFFDKAIKIIEKIGDFIQSYPPKKVFQEIKGIFNSQGKTQTLPNTSKS